MRRSTLLIRSLAIVAASMPVAPALAQAPAAPHPHAHAGPAHTAADVEFMQGMIGHHAQAVVMATMAASHGANAQVALFSRRILVSQRDEIQQMEDWLRERGAAVPRPAMAHGADQAGTGAHEHAMHMPGMLTAAQLAALDQARGRGFDRLFLTLMIQHHEGALAMVRRLFASPGAGQGPEVFSFASGVDADQRAEIERMQGMLAALGDG